MNEFKGTKGKWGVMEYSILETKVMCGNIRIADAKHYNRGDGDWTVNDPIELEGKANAKLISKAPEMLEMLKKLRAAILSEDYIRMLASSQEAFDLIKEATEV